MDGTKDSSACRALALPELLRPILAQLEDEKPTLAACMRVCKFWNCEAVCVLWARCGSANDVKEKRRQQPPQIRDLLNIIPIVRRQWYANHVEELVFGWQWRKPKQPSAILRHTITGHPPNHSSEDLQRSARHYEKMPSMVNELTYHPQLKDLEFPNLRTALLPGRDSWPDDCLNTPETIAQYLQPKLENLTLVAASFTRQLFRTLKVKCLIL